jgi:hypothetical protein
MRLGRVWKVEVLAGYYLGIGAEGAILVSLVSEANSGPWPAVGLGSPPIVTKSRIPLAIFEKFDPNTFSDPPRSPFTLRRRDLSQHPQRDLARSFWGQ